MLRPGELEPDQRVISNTPEAIRRLIARASLTVCYEAGPNGYAIQRLLASLDVACDVIAPSLIPRRSGDRVKTDRLDARNLARLHRAGELTAIRVPTAAEEALRDLVRLREGLKDDRRRMQHRIKSFLLRHGRRCPNHRRGWSRRYRMWISSQRFEDANTQLAFDHLLAALNTRTVQLDSIDQQLAEAADRPPLADAVGTSAQPSRYRDPVGPDYRERGLRLPSLRLGDIVHGVHGSRSLRALVGAARTTRVDHQDRQRAPATRARRGGVDLPAQPYVRPAMAARSIGQPPEVLAYSWQAQVRLHNRFKVVAARKNRNVAVVAVARELAGFIWGLMNERTEVV